MPEGDSLPTNRVVRPQSGATLDLAAEAHQFFRQRFRVAGTGAVIGCAFIGLGAYEVGLRATSGFSVEYLIALLMVFLGLAVIAVCLYSGLLNPVTRIRVDPSGVRFERRWGRPVALRWRDPRLQVDIDDRTDDPIPSKEAQSLLFFEGPGSTYGTLTPASLDSLLRVARTQGAAVSEKQLQSMERGQVHLIRRIRIRPAPPTSG